MRTMKITIVGAGNVGTQMAAHCAEKGHVVTVFGSKPDAVSNELTVINKNDEVIHSGTIEKATSDKQEAFDGVDLIFVTMPAPMMKMIAQKIEPYAGVGMKICLLPGTGGGECAFEGCIERGAVLFGTQRVPSVVRSIVYGRVVRAVGYRDQMYVSAVPKSETEACCYIIQELTGINTSALPNYMNITLTPSNPILHTTRLRVLFNDWKKGIVYDRVPLFYEEWDDQSSDLLLKCDEEVQTICKQIKELDLREVKSLRIHYESDSVKALTKKIRSITGFKGLTSPVIEYGGGYIPDFNSRYFTSDFSFGLSILLQIASFTGVDTPNLKETMKWYKDIVGDCDEYRFTDYGIDTYEKLISFYSR